MNPFPDWMQAEVALCDLELTAAPKTILDLGANIGAYAARAAAKWPDAKIHAFEPVEGTAIQLEANCPTAIVHRMAVRAQTGTEAIKLGDQPATCSFHQLGRQTGRTQMVACLSAADLPEFDLIKIDTEGCELEILRALMPWHFEAASAFVIEYHRREDVAPIVDHLAEFGFDLLQHIRTHAPVNGILKFGKPGRAKVAEKLYIGVAFGTDAPAGFLHSLIRLVRDPRIHAAIQIDNTDGSVAMARNELTAKFLATDCTKLLFVDNDLIFTPEHVMRVASHDLPVVGGMYPLKKEPELAWCGNGFPGREEKVGDDGLQRVRFIGTGFSCIRRDVIETLLAEDGPAHEFTLDHPPHEHRWDFWRFGVRPTDDNRRRYLTEDWWFCQRCLEHGIPVYADASVVLRHVGRVAFPTAAQLKAMNAQVGPNGDIVFADNPQSPIPNPQS